ncbi:LLM class flavin-dependent oxidoreductase [Kineosporia succinea]|uniref:Alkanesulfonate monooxygenase SsuD/methylene tetrahydromethanopterin reductase-like flavin-dependent oxidoreductase (Luciferase family)/FAD/FMN-containing dehydrogenase n=1 Tax=Kineosporia succinea TaxID=84632 RepID=A0ABT9P835_9ACTN|nr:LLM class flavin-dependent oxidoreductase [Kineosporia succinea]MDP9828867.1 alkanesulfonate monooxygenase SsuD/methylene tetrahydromethanopterin reductase-like flavin-dependent oxidoreductase (luciferase family)/FAD/FMN-containing dehydrogenase [Kineosporia succinea]
MPDYGHPIRFGTFITPTAANASRPGELAVLSEELGFDLVTFQDHPYQAGFLDTWTLLTWVAARTERIHLSGNVLNLPLRPPAVLARSAASLDLLSGGRVSLGLGAGAFWDAVEGMGGRRLTPGQAVDALSEAIDVMRGIWDAGERRPLRVDGEFHRVDGAKRGPAPAHTIPVWIGAYKPRMLRLTGRQGDGWLPSLPYLKPGDLAAGNKILDEEARAAGRDPAEIVRLLNISPNETADDLVRLALEEGASTFILASDDPRVLQAFSADVVPVVRERVAAARSASGVAEVVSVRTAAQKARRAEGIDYDGVPSSLAERAVEPADPAYARYRSGYLRGGAPGLVLRPQSIEQVSDAVLFASAHRDVPLGIFSAGHGLSGRSLNQGGLVIDVGALNRVEMVDAAGALVRVGPGALWVDVARELAPHGLAITSGDYGGVGVGGLATAGGVGWFAREHGLTVDLLRSVDVVLADGTVKHASEQENPDLFWAVRGAGANFGVAVSFTFEARPVEKVAFAQLVFDAADVPGFLTAWGAAIEAADRRVTGQVILGPPRGGRQVAQAMLLVNSSDPDTIVGILQPIADIAPLLDQSVALTTYDEVIGAFVSDAPQQAQGEPLSHSGNIGHLTPAFGREVEAMLAAGGSYFFSVRAVGGAVADVPADATAYAWRDANFSVAAFGSAPAGFDRYWDRLLPYFEGLYLSFETGTGPAALERAFPPAHLSRLRELKRRYDPTGLFRDNFFVPPA